MNEFLTQTIQRIKRLWNVWVGIAGGVFAIAVCGLVFLLVWVLTPEAETENSVLHAVVTRLPAPTRTPVVEVTPTPALDENVIDGIGFGMRVEIFDTGGSGLRFRAEPGIDAEIEFIASDGELFLVEGGPVEEDGFLWWFLVSADVNSRRGWAVSPYLRTVE